MVLILSSLFNLYNYTKGSNRKNKSKPKNSSLNKNNVKLKKKGPAMSGSFKIKRAECLITFLLKMQFLHPQGNGFLWFSSWNKSSSYLM